MKRALKKNNDAILTKEQAKEWAAKLNSQGGKPYWEHEYNYRAVRCADGWKVQKTYYCSGVVVFSDYLNYMSQEALHMNDQMYMDVQTGDVGIYEDWWYFELDKDGTFTGQKVNAVDRGEVVAVIWNRSKWEVKDDVKTLHGSKT